MAGDGTAALAFQHAADFLVDSLGWRVNTNVSFPVIVAQMVPVTLLADYHLTTSSSLIFAVNAGTNPSVDARVPNRDIDGDVRPQGLGADRGADEIAGPSADLSITKTDGKTTTIPGATNTYTIVVANAGPSTATDATVTDALPVSLLTGATWSCSATAGASCGSVSGSGSINTTVTLPNGASATFTVTTTVKAGTTGPVSNTATVDLAIDPNTANNSVTDTDQAPPPKPTLTVLDPFTRGNVFNLGSNWGQATFFGFAAIRVNNQQAFGSSAGNASWNTTFGTTQAAAFTIAGPTVNGDALILKSSGFSWIRVRVTGTQIVVEHTPLLGLSYTNLATFASVAGVGSTITALVDSTGQVSVWNGATFVGWVNAAGFTGGGGIGISLPTNGRIDNFAGGTVA